MIPVEEALRIIRKNQILLPLESVPVRQAAGRVLQESLYADRDFPPFDRVMMDGIAIQYEDWQEGTRRFTLVGTQLAGSPPQVLGGKGRALEIMTGAVCPADADCIIKVEELVFEPGDSPTWVEVKAESLQKGQNIHPKGLDQSQGQELLRPGCLLNSPEIAIATSIGKSELQVSRLPKIALISTGDELVEVEESPEIYQIRRSNIYALQAALEGLGISADDFHLTDSLDEIKEALEKILQEYDIVVLSGGVSKGKADYVPAALEQLGVKKAFHRVRQKPGKPFWFGTSPRAVVFALPGNPVSTMACFYRYVIPYVHRALGRKEPSPMKARLKEDFSFPADLQFFLPVWVSSDDQGILWAQAFPGHGSGDYSNLAQANGFLELPQKRQNFAAGEAYNFWSFRAL